MHIKCINQVTNHKSDFMFLFEFLLIFSLFVFLELAVGIVLE